MTDIILVGANGRMGIAICEMVQKKDDVKIFAGVDLDCTRRYDFHVYQSIDDIEDPKGVIVDFSNHKLTDGILKYASKHNLPAVIATTGHTAEEKANMLSYADKIPLFLSANMSLGVNLLVNLAKKAASLLQDSFDIEIIEKHHNQKLDAPSGTALLIADGIKDALDYTPEYVYERQSKKAKREKTEIGIHAVRGGTIVGEHEVIFAGKDEIVTLSHRADSREVFGAGAIKAAQFICGKPAGLYDMNAMLSEILQ